ncbi:MAG: carboxypeptidase-like regulatory domain-containing protein [Saprospiraceae bacterium]
MRPFLIVAFLLSISCIAAQDYFIITGTVVDAKTGKPLAYAHVGIPEKGIGTTTSLDGDFTLKIPNEYRQSTLLVSYVGYTTYRKAISNIQEPITIKVQSSPTNLQEIVVMDETGIENIIRRAVRAIPKNYVTHAVTNLGFYRESRTDAN